MNHAWISLLCFAGAFPLPTSTPFATPGSVRTVEPQGAIEIPLEPYAGPLRTIQVKLGDFEAPFLFDTGGGFTVLSTATARRVGCTAFGRGTGFRHDGSRAEGQRGTPVSLSIGAFTRRGEVGVLDLDGLLQGLPPVGGIASLETFAGKQLSIDLARGRLIVENAKSLAERTDGAREIRMRIARQAGGAALDVFVAIEGKHGLLWFELDSGNVAPVLIAPHAFEELGVEAPRPGETRAIDLPLAGFGAVKCQIVAKELIYDGLLNAEFFQRHVVTLDLEHARAWLRSNS